MFSILVLTLVVVSSVLGVIQDTSYPLHPSETGRYFTTIDANRDPQPFFWQADTAWVLFHRLTLDEAEVYLEDRRAKGFTVILAVGVTQFGQRNPNRLGQLPLVDEDLTRPNESYWQHVDSVVELAWSKGIRVAFVPTWGQYVHSSDNVPGLMNTSNAFAFGEWFGKRYPGSPKLLVADTNPYWTNKMKVKDDYAIGGVHAPAAVTDYSPVYDALANGLRAGEGDSAMITMHPTNQWFEPGPLALASAFFGDRDWLTFDTSQSGHSDFPPNPPIPWWNARRGYEPVELMYQQTRWKTRPVLDNEPHYEHRFNNARPGLPYWNASDVRIGSYQAVFAGAAGVTYGADNVMQFYIPGIYSHSGSGPAASWAEDIHLPGSGQIQYVRKVVTERKAYPNLVPNQGLIVGDAGVNDRHVGVLSGEGVVMAFTPTGATFTLDTSGLAGRTVNASWYDPLHGEYSGFSAMFGQGQTTFSPPKSDEHSDWVLVLEA